MKLEIERKFLLISDAWRARVRKITCIRQGYFARSGAHSVRVRLSEDQAWLAIKSAKAALVRAEYEYAIPADDARDLLTHACAGRTLDKTRHEVEAEGLFWSIDVYNGRHLGLVLAETELETPQSPVSLPAWIGREVTGDPYFSNETLANR